MKSIFIDMEKLRNLHSGLGQFCFHLGKAYQELIQTSLDLNFYLPRKQVGLFGKDFNYIPYKLIHKVLFPIKKNFDVWHCLHQQSNYLPTHNNTKLLLTIHDLNYLEKYTGIKKSLKHKALQSLVDRATAVTAISHFTKSVIEAHLDLHNKPIHVIHNGVALQHSDDDSLPDFIRGKEYLFSIGIIAPKKNFHVLLPLLQQTKDLHLVIAGDASSAYAEKIKTEALKLGLENRLHLTGSIDERLKYALYKHCKAFVFPSLTEGFGLPVIEAMSLGKPVFLSSLSSLPEVGGTEAFYWKHFDGKYMAQTLDLGLQDYRTNPQKAQKIIDWANTFSWKTAALKYLKIYKSL